MQPLPYSQGMAPSERIPKTPTSTCAFCAKPIRLYKAQVWGARKQDDPHPWYCDKTSNTDGRHAPANTVNGS